MKSVVFSDIEPVLHRPARPFVRVQRLAPLALMLALGLPARLEVSTRFYACHLVGILDETMDKLGYVPAERSPGALRYRSRAGGWARLPKRDIAVTVLDHALEVTGPVPALRALRRRLAC